MSAVPHPPSPHASPEAFCDAWLAAWDGNRPRHLVSFYAPDCFYVDPARPEGVHGRDALLAYFRKLCAANPVMEWTREALWPTAEGFIVKWRARVPVEGVDVRLAGMDVVELDAAGRIARNEVFFDASAWKARLAARSEKKKS